MSNWADSQEYQDELNKGFRYGRYINPGQISQFMKPTQDIISNITNTGQGLMDPNSSVNLGMRRIMEQRAAEAGQQQMMNARRLAAQTGMSPGQAMMNSQIGMNRAMGDVNQQFQSGLNARFSQGLGAMQSMGQMQQGLGSMYANAYLARMKQNKTKEARTHASRNLGHYVYRGMADRGLY